MKLRRKIPSCFSVALELLVLPGNPNLLVFLTGVWLSSQDMLLVPPLRLGYTKVCQTGFVYSC